jgi:uncharacterized damage-inducible protein DinB
MQQLLLSQYESVKGARQALFSYCKSMNESDLFKKVDAFNNSSIVDLLVHSANTYISWLNNLGLDAGAPFYESGDIKSLAEVEQIFGDVDRFVPDFLQKYSAGYEQPFTKTIAHRGIVVTVTPLQLFTHVITHEFHHKGQILTMSRLLGYIPVDTDVIRT